MSVRIWERPDSRSRGQERRKENWPAGRIHLLLDQYNVCVINLNSALAFSWWENEDIFVVLMMYIKSEITFVQKCSGFYAEEKKFCLASNNKIYFILFLCPYMTETYVKKPNVVGMVQATICVNK